MTANRSTAAELTCASMLDKGWIETERDERAPTKAVLYTKAVFLAAFLYRISSIAALSFRFGVGLRGKAIVESCLSLQRRGAWVPTGPRISGRVDWMGTASCGMPEETREGGFRSDKATV